MSEEPTGARAASTEDPGAKAPEELQRDIEQTRADLGDTVDALSQKADVKAQLKAATNEQKAKLRAKREQFAQRLAQRSGDGGGRRDVAAQGQRIASELAERTSRQPLSYLGGALAVGVLLGRLMAPHRRPR